MAHKKDTAPLNKFDPLRSAANQAQDDSFKNESWGEARENLQNALDLWSDLSEEPIRPAPDQQKLKEIKSILSDLQKKMADFE